jgi:hypothetical protein
LNQKEDGNEEAHSEHHDEKRIETHSVGSSGTSDRSKAVLLLKKKREIMEERLDTPIKGFIRNSNLFTLLFFLLMAASASLSYTLIYTTNDGMLMSLYINFIIF